MSNSTRSVKRVNNAVHAVVGAYKSNPDPRICVEQFWLAIGSALWAGAILLFGIGLGHYAATGAAYLPAPLSAA